MEEKQDREEAEATRGATSGSKRRANVKKKMSEQALVFHRGPIRKHQLAPRCTLSEEVVVLSSSLPYFCISVIQTKTERLFSSSDQEVQIQ